jgi:putative oxidoreductase
MSFSERISPLLGRVALAWFFLQAAVSIIGDYQNQALLMRMKHFPVPELLLVAVLMVLILGGLSLLVGFHIRSGALMLFAFTMVVTMLWHDFWHIANPVERQAEYEFFARNIAIAGGLLMLVGMGPGAFALDNALAPPKKR